MTGTLDGFAFSAADKDISSPGGWRQRTLFVITADSLDAAKEIARHYKPTATFVAKGAKVLAKARELGVGDNDVKLVDGALKDLLGP